MLDQNSDLADVCRYYKGRLILTTACILSFGFLLSICGFCAWGLWKRITMIKIWGACLVKWLKNIKAQSSVNYIFKKINNMKWLYVFLKAYTPKGGRTPWNTASLGASGGGQPPIAGKPSVSPPQWEGPSPSSPAISSGTLPRIRDLFGTGKQS